MTKIKSHLVEPPHNTEDCIPVFNYMLKKAPYYGSFTTAMLLAKIEVEDRERLSKCSWAFSSEDKSAYDDFLVKNGYAKREVDGHPDIYWISLTKRGRKLKEYGLFAEYEKYVLEKKETERAQRTLSVEVPRNQKFTNKIMVAIVFLNFIVASIGATILWLQYEELKKEKVTKVDIVKPSPFSLPDTVKILQLHRSKPTRHK